MANNPFPYILGSSTGSLMQDFDTDVYNTASSSTVYKLVDALCGSTGAGALINQVFLNQLQGNLGTTYGADLDYFFGNIGFLPRAPSEMYIYNAGQDLLNSDQWDEVRVKDAWYRARIKDFWKACNMGGTPEAIRMICQAAVACDCNVFEVWRYIDDFGITESIGRADARNEVVVQPLKSSLTPQEFKLLRDMLQRVMSVETIVTINTEGLGVLEPVQLNAACANSVYYQVEKVFQATPVLANFPSVNSLPVSLLPTETWLFDAKTTPTLAPYAQLNITAQYGYYYLVGGGAHSPIDSVTYGRLQNDGSTNNTPNFVAFQTSSQYTPFTGWPQADSPDNFPGGKFGQHPTYPPAINSDGTAYQFPWTSQAAFVAAQSQIVTEMGGTANAQGYQLPISAPNQTQLAFLPEYAVAYSPPGRDSTISANVSRNRQVQESGTQGWTSQTGFVRS